MWQPSGLINTLLGLILLSGTTTAFRFPNEGRGRTMPRTSLVPPPPRGIRHLTSGRLSSHQRQWRPPVPTTFGRSTGWKWPQQVQQQQVTSRHNRFPMQQHLSHLQPQPVQKQVTSRQHPQPRKLQWEPPVRTLQQAMGIDDLGAAASNRLRFIAPSPSAAANGMYSAQATTGEESSSNNPPSHILPMDEATAFCQRCEMLNSMASAACCSGHRMCCQQSIPYHSQNQFQQQTQQSYYPLQGPQLGPYQLYQQRNSQQQGHAQGPAHHIFNTDNVNIYNTYDSQFNPGNVEPAYDIRPDIQGQDYEEPEYPDAFPTEDDSQQDGFDSTGHRQSSLGDLVGGAAISMISLFVRMAAGDGAENLDDRHRMIG